MPVRLDSPPHVIDRLPEILARDTQSLEKSRRPLAPLRDLPLERLDDEGVAADTKGARLFIDSGEQRLREMNAGRHGENLATIFTIMVVLAPVTSARYTAGQARHHAGG